MSSHRPHRPPPLAAVVAVPLVFAVLLLVFAWPAARLAPRDLPLGLVGGVAETRAIGARLSTDDRFVVERYANEPAARAAIADREVYGAVVVSESGKALLTASAASPLVARVLEQAIADVPGALPTDISNTQVEDVVPIDPDDPLGSVFASLVLPLILSALMLAIFVIVSHAGRPWRQAAVMLAAAGGAALVGVGVIQGWLAALEGPWLVNAGVLLLTVLAISGALVGLAAVFGYPGLALGAVMVVLLGNAWSAVTSASELLPEPAGLIGQLLPPGAGASLLRSTAYFGGEGWMTPLAVLVTWTTVGLIGVWIGSSAGAPRWIGRRTDSQALGANDVVRVRS